MTLHVRKPDFVYANNKDADQTAHLRSLVSAFVIRSLECALVRLSIFYIVFVAEQTRLSPIRLRISKTGLLASWPIFGIIFLLLRRSIVING